MFTGPSRLPDGELGVSSPPANSKTIKKLSGLGVFSEQQHGPGYDGSSAGDQPAG